MCSAGESEVWRGPEGIWHIAQSGSAPVKTTSPWRQMISETREATDVQQTHVPFLSFDGMKTKWNSYMYL